MRYLIEPKAKPRPRVTKNGTFMPDDYTKWKTDCAKLGVRLPDRFGVRFYFAMPKSWSKRKRAEMAFEPHTQTPDLDNVLGGLMDAARKDDSSIYEVHADKFWGHESSIEVWSLESASSNEPTEAERIPTEP